MEPADTGQGTSVVVVDDHPSLRWGVRAVLACSPQLRVVAEAADGPEALTVVRQHRPDLVVLDLLLPHMNGVEVMRALRAELPDVKFVAYSLRDDAWFVEEALAAGAARYVSKKSSPGELLSAVEQAASSPATPAVEPARQAEESAILRPMGLRLSKREGEALKLLARGLRVKDAAQRLSVGVRTLETYKARAMQKLQLRSRADLLRFAEHCGWLDEDASAS